MVRVTWAACLLSAVVFSGCTRTAEVLSRQVESQSSTAAETDSAVITQDVASGDMSSRTFASSDVTVVGTTASIETSTDSSSSTPFEPLIAPELGVGTALNTTCAFLNYEDGESNTVDAVFACFGQDDLEPLTLSELSPAARQARLVSIIGGERHVCLLTSEGDVWCWGDNSLGQLGGFAGERTAVPTKVVLPEPVQRISSGAAHVCAISATRTLYCWGDNSEGQLGLGNLDSDAGAPQHERGVPVAVDADPWISVGAGLRHTCGVKSDGSAWCWGRNREGQVSEDPGAQFASPHRVNTDHSWHQVVAGEVHTCALRSDGTLWCWGSNAEDLEYPLGLTSSAQPLGPTQIGDDRWKSLAARWAHTCAVSQGNELSCWGRNTQGQLGTGDNELRREPTSVADGVAEVTVGLDHTCITTTDLDILCSGSNQFGQLGIPESEHQLRFTSLIAEWSELLAVRFVR